MPPPNAPADEVYSALEDHKAQAIAVELKTSGDSESESEQFSFTSSSTSSSSSPLVFTNHVAGQPNPATAAMAALAACEEARRSRLTPTQPCELRRRNNQLIHSTQELTEGLNANRPAFIWRLQHNNNLVYLAGSIHVLKPTLQAPPSYVQAFERSSTLVLEVDRNALSAEHLQTLVQRYSELPDDLTLSDLLETGDFAQVLRYLTNVGLGTAEANRTKPAMLLLQAGVLEYIAMGYLAQHGIDSVFEERRGARTLLGLETMEQQLEAATALPLPLQAELLMETISEAELASDQISTLVHAWLSGDAHYLSSQFENTTDSEAARQWLNDLLAKRNVGMAQGIATLLRGEDPRIPANRSVPNNGGLRGSVFVIVGAAHLVGRGSVIELLEQQGFTAKRLRYDSLESID